MSPSTGSLMALDASVALAFVLADEPLHLQAVSLIQTLAARNIELCAPPLFVYECDSILRLRAFTGKLTESEAQAARAILSVLQIHVEHEPLTQERAYAIARDYHQPRVYDATYAAFAEVRGVELVTTDEPFYQAVNGSKRPRAMPPLTFVKLLS